MKNNVKINKYSTTKEKQFHSKSANENKIQKTKTICLSKKVTHYFSQSSKYQFGNSKLMKNQQISQCFSQKKEEKRDQNLMKFISASQNAQIDKYFASLIE